MMRKSQLHIRSDDYSYSNQGGFASLIFVILLTIVGMQFALLSSEFSFNNLLNSYYVYKSDRALFIAESCAEDVLRQIKLNTDYGVGSGAIILNIAGGECSMNITSVGLNERNVIIKGTIDNFSKNLDILVSFSGDDLSIDRW